jgi:hypothetical protein
MTGAEQADLLRLGLDLRGLAGQVVAGETDATEIEEFLCSKIESEIFDLEHDLRHGNADRFTRRRLTELNWQRDHLFREWSRVLIEAEYHADKLEELDVAPDSATASDAVSRWNVLDGNPRIAAPLPSAEPPFALPTATPAGVYAAVLHEVRIFLARCDDPAAVPPRVLLTSETGSRKTGITLHALAPWIRERKTAHRAHRVVLMVPAHRLGQQILIDARAAGINAATFEGRDLGCRNTEAVALAREAGADINSAVCGSGQSGSCCPFREWCGTDGYFGGLHRAAKADMVICAHNFAFEELPRTLLHDVALAVIDEGFTALADVRFDLALSTIDVATVHRFPMLDDDDNPDPVATIDLQRSLHEPLIEAAKSCIDGYLAVDALRDVGFTIMADAPSRMRAANWRRKVPVQMRPGMSLEDRKAAARGAAVNAQLPRIAALTHALEAMLTRGDKAAGYVSVRLDVRRTGSQVVLTVRSQREPAAWLKDLPVLMLNATGRAEDLRRVFPSAEAPEMPRARWENFEVHQILGGFGRSTLARHPTRLQEMRDLLTVTMMGKQRSMVAIHKPCEDAFAGISGVATEHHGNLAGSNDHQDADIGFVIGGAFADSKEVASIAAARGAGAVMPRPPGRVNRAALLISGTAVGIECLAYEDPATDAAHRGIYDASIVQAIGRMRPMQRRTNNPAIGFVFANVALPFPVTSVRLWRDVRPSRIVRMVAGGRVWLNAKHMAIFRPDLFRSAKAAETARARFAPAIGDVIEAVRAIVRHDVQPWVKVVYQPHGQGQRISSLIVRALDESAAREDVEAELGDLRLYNVLRFTPGREVTPASLNQTFTPVEGVTSAAVDPIRPPHLDPGCLHARAPPDG